MMRSLWTAASGMKTQQLVVDTIANNLANVNTVGFKKERMEFKSLLYETLEAAGTVDQGGQPVNLQIGHGVRAAGSVKTYTQGNLERTENPLDFALAGGGFFAIQDTDGELRFSKDGAFKMSLNNGELTLTDVNGNAVIGSDGAPMVFEENTLPQNLSVDAQGNFFYTSGGATFDLGVQFQIVQFRNISGLKAVGNGLMEQTAASGPPLAEIDNQDLDPSTVNQGTLESSNVQAVEEMVKMIIAQRAYELSSKAIQTSDDMLGLANGLKR